MDDENINPRLIEAEGVEYVLVRELLNCIFASCKAAWIDDFRYKQLQHIEFTRLTIDSRSHCAADYLQAVQIVEQINAYFYHCRGKRAVSADIVRGTNRFMTEVWPHLRDSLRLSYKHCKGKRGQSAQRIYYAIKEILLAIFPDEKEDTVMSRFRKIKRMYVLPLHKATMRRDVLAARDLDSTLDVIAQYQNGIYAARVADFRNHDRNTLAKFYNHHLVK